MVEMSSLHEESNAQLARTPIVRVIDDWGGARNLDLKVQAL